MHCYEYSNSTSAVLFIASESVAEIIENYHRDNEEQLQQVSAGSLVPPDIFVKLQFGDDSRVCFVFVLSSHLQILCI